ncbi:hypothetical protein AC579_809 [Pseudocercospora musae]|uniref:Uncharacterized protein n=1 Tax=Pseudocercospora musae TaxID=113226 RepID=A0A139IBU7_9PEZI|nr:hypothetical protein AC579_809 [Pseudocercospora musae]KXT12230.1 hypothetical protein AC579_809 [Pseudocercospora musae]KXT12234.1 hypothetical protein AC579_809 [Pseudocercospora musae]
MPRSICDSEDEGEVFVQDDRPAQRSQRSTLSIQPVLATFPFESMTDGANERSSLSTEELNRQIQDAQRAFFNSTADDSTTSKHRLSRRQTTVAAPSPAPTPSRSTKRTKTLTTYASGRASRTLNTHNPAFDALRDDQADQQASQSPRFSDRSGRFGSERALPHGTIEDDFAKHNPNVMFRDTGSTVAFNESSEQRMLEQALQDVRQPVSSAAKLAESEKNPSSPAWLWAHTTQSPHSNQSKKSVRRDADSNQDETEQAGKVAEPVHRPQQDLVAATNEPVEGLVENETRIPDDLKIAEQSQPQVSALPTPSPQVIVHTNGTPEETPSDNTTHKSARGRKRKPSTSIQEASSEPLNSEDLLVGLPKELYQPKPSRRRMTGLAEQPIDYSVVPERAAKKRRKTLNDASTNPEHVDEPIARPAKTSEKQSTSKMSKRDQAVSSTIPNKSTPGTPEKPAAPNARSPPRPVASPLTSPETEKAKQSPIKVAAPRAKPSPSPSEMGPPSLPASSMKKKVPRSHTTIFEDCSQSSQKSPSLRQQQADRRSALQGPGRRKAAVNKPRRRIVQDDEDDEDELSKEVEQEALAPRKRGRPAKLDSQNAIAADRGSIQDLSDEGEDDEALRKRGRKAKSTQKVLEGCDARDGVVATESVKKGRESVSAEMVQDDSAAEDVVEPAAEDELRQSKKKRGRTAKSKVDAAPTPGPEPDGDNTSKAVACAASRDPDGESNVLKAKATNTLLIAKEVTPVPGSGTSKETAPHQPQSASKSGSMIHSPIKKTSKILNHRVGLNKKSRIPPLLKVVRPQQRKEVERVTKVISVAELERMAAAKLDE